MDLYVYGGVCERGLATIGCIRVPQRCASLAVDLYWLNSPAFSRQMAFLWRWQRSSAPTFASAWDMNREALNPRPLLIFQEHRMVMLPTRQFTKQNKTSIGSDLSEFGAEKGGTDFARPWRSVYYPRPVNFPGSSRYACGCKCNEDRRRWCSSLSVPSTMPI